VTVLLKPPKPCVVRFQIRNVQTLLSVRMCVLCDSLNVQLIDLGILDGKISFANQTPPTLNAADCCNLVAW